MNDLAKNLRALRKRSKLTQVELAERVGVHEVTLRRWERGSMQPRASDIQKLCEVLGCTESELLSGPNSTDIVVKIKREREEVGDLSIEVDMTGRDLVQSVTVAGDRIGIGIVYGGGKTLRDVCDELLRREEQFEKMRMDARVGR